MKSLRHTHTHTQAHSHKLEQSRFLFACFNFRVGKALLRITKNSEAMGEKTEISEYKKKEKRKKRKPLNTSVKQHQLFKRQAIDSGRCL